MQRVKVAYQYHSKNIAEYVLETVEQQELLTRLGCHTLQGYLLGKPMPAELLVKSLTASRHL